MADRDALIKGFLKRNAKGKPPRREGSLNLGNEEGSLSPARLKRANQKYKGGRIMEDDPRWNPATMGNKRWGKGYRGALNYNKGSGRPS